MECVFMFCKRCHEERKHSFEIKFLKEGRLLYDDDRYTDYQLSAFMNGEFCDYEESVQYNNFKCLSCGCVVSNKRV